MNKHSGYITSDYGAKLYYERMGTGPTLLFLHGFHCSLEFFKRNVNTLANDYQVVAIDFRGHGKSSKELAGHTIDQYARDVRKVIEELSLHNVHMIAWSMAGPVALSYWTQFQAEHRLETISFIDISPAPMSSERWNTHNLRDHNTEQMMRTIDEMEKDRKRYLNKFMLGMFLHDYSITSVQKKWIIEELLKTPTSIAQVIYTDNATLDQENVLSQINIPTLVCGANSRKRIESDYDMNKYIAKQLPNSELHLFEDAGHMLFYEQPKKFNQVLSTFIEQNLS